MCMKEENRFQTSVSEELQCLNAAVQTSSSFSSTELPSLQALPCAWAACYSDNSVEGKSFYWLCQVTADKVSWGPTRSLEEAGNVCYHGLMLCLSGDSVLCSSFLSPQILVVWEHLLCAYHAITSSIFFRQHPTRLALLDYYLSADWGCIQKHDP